MAYVSLDLETTGLNPELDEIIEIGAVKFQGEEIVDTFQTLVNPGCPIPYRISMLTGITQAQVNAAPYLFEVRNRLLEFIGDSVILGHKISFDIDFLTAKGVPLANTLYDTLDLANVLLPIHPEHNLAEMVRHFEIKCDEHHRALADAQAARDLFLALINLAAGLDPSVISELQRLSLEVNWPAGAVFAALTGQTRPVKAKEAAGAPAAPATGGVDLRMEDLATALEPGGAVASCFSDYEYRPCQIDMLKAVIDAFTNNHHAIVEAGTGTGKSMAYLLPAMAFSMSQNLPVVVSTNTINLQEQLVGKDIPILAGILGLGQKLRVAQLKGRSNYLCPKRYDIFRKRTDLNLDKGLFLATLAVWLAETESGDRAELNLTNFEMGNWHGVCAPSEGCLQSKCSYYSQDRCFLHNARKKASKAHVVIINHALLFSDIVSKSKILPTFNHLVIDEAHHLEEAATEQLGFRVSKAELIDNLEQIRKVAGGRRLQENLRSTGVGVQRTQQIMAVAAEAADSLDRIQARVNHFFSSLSQFTYAHTGSRGSLDYERRLPVTRRITEQPEWLQIQAGWDEVEAGYRGLDAGLEQLYAALDGLETGPQAEHEALLMELTTAAQFAATSTNNINSIMVTPKEDEIYWLTLQPERDNLTLCMAPLHIGAILQELLFSQKNCIILTSATLSSAGNFTYVKERLGLDGIAELCLPPPFDYKKSTLLCLPQDVPEVERPGFNEALQTWLGELIRAAGGRTLVLFTSHNALRTAYGALQRQLEEEGILLIGQGLDGSPRQLLNVFKSTPNTALFGTSSFWEGVDVVGKALSLLVITRLPFAVPDDPIISARSETYDNPFEQFTLPQAILRFKQGFGRLIRSHSDRGVTVLFDPRIQRRSYGNWFLRSLPECTVKKLRLREAGREVKEWLAE